MTREERIQSIVNLFVIAWRKHAAGLPVPLTLLYEMASIAVNCTDATREPETKSNG